MKLLREFMLNKYRQYIADQKRLQGIDAIRAELAETRLAQDSLDALLSDLSRFHATLVALQRSDVSHDYRDAMGDVCAVFMAVLGEHLRAKS